MKNKKFSTRNIAIIGMFSAISFVLMLFEIPVPLMPPFVKFDLSDLPALVGSFALGPVEGVLICLLKNVLKLTKSSSAGVGELSNFIIGATFVFIAGFIYKKKKNRKGALIGSLAGAVAMALISVVSNYFIVYPFYTNFMPMEDIIKAYQIINPNVHTLLEALLIFNMPFTFIKGMINVLITFIIYKSLSPIIKGHH